ncbi:protein translocase subunit SecD [Pseudanabaena sp. FACHB-1277]|uniref:Protein translocase subunit SecD n=1 Tax=Pseudanabaena cinerea FACHB-1277 TaxID=2949581 RepID=A0A926Z6X4_9CYAN|nr:protein translocase subunit SecD [Pseudanabaena cinerea]MBD2151190.1 protein translocase subunit SecD [Pseudanabaena cinerea FACHB-1277]
MGKQSRLLALVLAVLVGAVYLIINVPPKLGLDLRGGAQLTLQAKLNPEQGINEITPKLMETARFVVEQRINGLGVSEATILLSGNNQLIVQLPGVNDPAQAERVIGTTAQLDFRKQKKGTESELRARLQIQQAATIQREVLKNGGDAKAIAENEAAYKKSIEDLKGIFETTGFTGNMLKDAVAAPTGNGGNDTWQVALTFDDKGGELFAKTTAELGGTGRVLGIFLDDKLISYPSVGPEFQGKGITGGRAVITGNFTLDTANELALQLRAGALPVPVEIVENRTVGATLGADSILSSIYAGAAGLALVLIFMVLYYRILGVVADIALITYAIITFSLFGLLGVVLTLPGIAGFILSIGMAVDANVLIFERTMEELRASRTLYKSVEAGFYRAWSSILDSNVTTLISCVALFWLGSGFVKGFAVTLGVGVITSMFTAITLSRSLLLAMISNPAFRKPAYYGVKSFGKISAATTEAIAVEPDSSNKPNDTTNDTTSGAVL